MKNMKKILFISRHNLSAEQKNILSTKLWKISVDKVEIIFSDWTEITPFIWKYDEFIIVAPNEIMTTIINKGIKPLQFVMSFRDENWKPLQSPRCLGIKRIITIKEEML